MNSVLVIAGSEYTRLQHAYHRLTTGLPQAYHRLTTGRHGFGMTVTAVEGTPWVGMTGTGKGGYTGGLDNRNSSWREHRGLG